MRASGKNLVVIGSGPGGAAAAALLAHAGYRVTLLERNRFPGGRCSSLPHHGFLIDAGVHMFGRGPLGPFGEISRILGTGPRWSAPLPSFTPYLPGRGGIDMCARLFHPASLRALASARLRGWQNMALFSTAARASSSLGVANILRLGSDFRRCRYPSLAEREDISVRDFFAPFGISQDFERAMRCMVMLTMALPWHRASMGEFFYIMASAIKANRLCYPLGGPGAIASSFLRALRERGGAVRLGCAAARIEVDEGRAVGVTTGEGEFIPADLVVSNAGLKATVELVGRGGFDPAYLRAAESRRESEAFIAVKLLLDRGISRVRTPCLLRLPALPPQGMFDYLEDGSVPDDLFLFVTVPSRWDPSLAPPGKDLLLAGVPAPSSPEREGQCRLLLDRAGELLAEMFPEVTEGTEERLELRTADVSRLSGRPTGECIGLAQEAGRSLHERPDQATPVEGLYLVGADAGGRGIGTEMAADSALRLYRLLGSCP